MNRCVDCGAEIEYDHLWGWFDCNVDRGGFNCPANGDGHIPTPGPGA